LLLYTECKQLTTSSQETHDGISGAGNVDEVLAPIVGLGLPRRMPAGGVGAGRSGTDTAELAVVGATRCWAMLLHRQQVSLHAAKSAFPYWQRTPH